MCKVTGVQLGRTIGSTQRGITSLCWARQCHITRPRHAVPTCNLVFAHLQLLLLLLCCARGQLQQVNLLQQALQLHTQRSSGRPGGAG